MNALELSHQFLRRRNFLINGDFRLAQRGVSLISPASGDYTLDRWRMRYDGTLGTATISRQVFTLGQTDIPGEPTNFFRWASTVAGTGQTYQEIHQVVEDVRTLSGQSSSLSFYAKADAVRNITVEVEQNFGSGGSPSSPVVLASSTYALSTSWKRYSLDTIVMAAVANKTLGTNGNHGVVVRIKVPVNSTFTIDLYGLLFAEGNKAKGSYIERAFQEEHELSKRYFEKSYNLDDAPGLASSTTSACFLSSGSAGNGRDCRQYSTTKRTTATIHTYSPVTGTIDKVRDFGAGSDVSFAGVDGSSVSQFNWQQSFSALSSVAWHWTADSEIYIP